MPPLYSTMPTLWLPPKVWFQGSQSSSTGASSAMKGKVCSSICWLLHNMPWVVMTAFGCLVEPEVNRNLAMVAAPTPALAWSTPAGAVSSRLAKRVAPLSPPVSRISSASAGSTAASARA